MTRPCARYLRGASKLLEFIDFIDMTTDALSFLSKTFGTPAKSGEAGKKQRPSEPPFRKSLKNHSGLMYEMALCRAVDGYLTYLTELLAIIFKTRPEILRSSDQVTLDFVLGHPTLPRLVSALVERKVNQLSYQGTRDLARFLEKRL